MAGSRVKVCKGKQGKLRIPPIHCESPTWWQEFDIYIEIRNRRKFISIGTPPEKPKRIYESPLREAMRCQRLLNDPYIRSQLDIARELGITKARVSQVMALLKLTPEIQKALLALQDQNIIRFFSERRLRPLLTIKSPRKQIREFNKMKEQIQLELNSSLLPDYRFSNP